MPPEMQGETGLHHAVKESHEYRSGQRQEETIWEKKDYFQFSLGEEVYAFETHDILEVIPSPKITHVPTAPEYVLGVFHHRGAVIPAVDLGKIFGLPLLSPRPAVGGSPAPPQGGPALHSSAARGPGSVSGSRCVIIRAGKNISAFIPDSVIGVTSIPRKAIEPSLPSGPIDPGYVSGQVRLKDKTLVVLDARGILEGSRVRAAG